MPGPGVAADSGTEGGCMIDQSHYAVRSASRPERLAAAQAEIDAAVTAYLQAGGTIEQLDNKGKPVEHLSWKEEAKRTKAAGLSHTVVRGHLVLRETTVSRPEAARAARQRTIKTATEARSRINVERRAKLAPQVRILAECRWTISQIADHLEIAPGTVRRIAREHGIELTGQRSAEAGAR